MGRMRRPGGEFPGEGVGEKVYTIAVTEPKNLAGKGEPLIEEVAGLLARGVIDPGEFRLSEASDALLEGLEACGSAEGRKERPAAPAAALWAFLALAAGRDGRARVTLSMVNAAMREIVLAATLERMTRLGLLEGYCMRGVFRGGTSTVETRMTPAGEALLLEAGPPADGSPRG